NTTHLPGADVEGTRREIEEVIGLDASRAVATSAKEGVGIEELLEEIVQDVPPPKGDPGAPLKALIFDSWYDSYRGVIMLVRIVEGTVRPCRDSRRSSRWSSPGSSRWTRRITNRRATRWRSCG